MQLLKNSVDIFFKGGSVGVFEKGVAQNEQNIPFPNIKIKYHKLTTNMYVKLASVTLFLLECPSISVQVLPRVGPKLAP
jgi:hypothetical protein